jgi:excisionase family DNA binding protein
MTRRETHNMHRLLDYEEAAKVLGTWRRSGIRFPRRLVEERRVRFVRVGRHIRIPADALAEYIAAQTVQPVTLQRERAVA